MEEERTVILTEETEARDRAISQSARKVFSRMGLACCIMIAAASLISILLSLLLSSAFPRLAAEGWMALVVSTFSTQLVAMSLACLLLRKMPRFVTDRQSIGAGTVLKCIPVCIFLGVCGNLIATVLGWLFGRLFGISSGNTVDTIASMDVPFWLLFLLLAVIGPFFEELLFRKALIDRMRGYGERLAVVTSALMFGLMHGNFTQFCYTTLIGLLLGYIYLRSGSIWMSYALHFSLNLISGVIPLELAKNPKLEGLILGTPSAETFDITALIGDPSTIPFVIYVYVILAVFITGLVIFIKNVKRVHFYQAPLQIRKESAFPSVWLNLGMILFFLLCTANVIFFILRSQ